MESLLSFYHYGKCFRKVASKPLREKRRLFVASSLFSISMKKGLK